MPSLRRYRDPKRIADPTEGFARRLAEFHPHYSDEIWQALSPGRRWSYIRGLLSIPERAQGATVRGEENDR